MRAAQVIAAAWGHMPGVEIVGEMSWRGVVLLVGWGGVDGSEGGSNGG